MADVPAPPTPARATSSRKDTIESVLIAFILAFIFRTFVVEAFVIPTGSMAPTLLGAHMQYACVNCGYRFDVNYSGRNVGNDVEIPPIAPQVIERVPKVDAFGTVRIVEQPVDKVYGVHCPNCGYQVPRDLPNDPQNDATAPPIYYGDRILVLKYAWLFSQPARWDVVVFKSPEPLPPAPLYATNYIKRLVGRPGESVMVLDGDVYIGGPDAEPEAFKVQRKPREAQEALWRIVYDNDHQPGKRTDSTFRQPWTTVDGNGWKFGAPSDRGAIAFDNASGAGTLSFDAEANPFAHSFTDWLAYDETINQPTEPRDPETKGDTFNRGFTPRSLMPKRTFADRAIAPADNVSDLKLQFYYQRHSGNGALRLQLTKLDHTFTVEFTPGKAALFHRLGAGGGPDDLGQPMGEARDVPALKSSGPVEIELTNADYEIRLRVAGHDVLTATYEPNMQALLKAWRNNDLMPKPEVRLIAANQISTLSHISLWRDGYYTNRDRAGRSLRHATPDDPARLGDDEYFVLGDNSLISADARYWDNPIDLPAEDLRTDAGKVPGRFMLGKAFFVYWPAGYRPFSPKMPGAIPNFGSMRFIH